MSNLKIQNLKTESLIPYARNAKKHDDAQVALIAGSIREFGFNAPVAVRGEPPTIVAGHGRVLAARKLGMAEVPCVRLDHLTETQMRAYILADNKLAEKGGGWDEEMLRLEVEELAELDVDLGEIGISDEELAELTNEENEGLTDADETPEPPAQPVSVLGDVWVMGKHRVMCGSSTEVTTVEKLMAGEKADMVFTDPPYGVSYTDSLGRSIKNDELTDGDLQEFLRDAFVSGVTVSASDCPWYVWHADRFTTEFVAALEEAGLRVRQQIIWVKGEGREGTAEVAAPAIGGAHYRFLHEPCWYASLGTPFNAGNRKTTTVWTVTRQTTGTVHPTQKPTDLIKIALDNSSKLGQIILDLFGGSGSTLIACEQLGRQARLMELDPKYVDVIVTRWQEFTGKQAVNEATGLTFEATKAKMLGK